MPENRNPTPTRDSFPRRFLELAVLTGLAVAQPLYDLLTRAPEFLPVHGAGLLETLLLVVGLSLGLPLLWAAAIHLLGLRGKPAARLLHTSSLYLLATLFFLQLADIRGGEPVRVAVVAFGLGLTFAVLDRRTEWVRRFLLYLTPAILIFPTVFLTRPGVRAVVSPPPIERTAAAHEGATVPVVFIVFDGLPLTSLLESARQIDPVRHPALDRLACTATWFPRATSVADNTLEALPAILSGRLPGEPLPTAAYYPKTLFTLLGTSHEMVVDEPLTRLCPADLCPDPGPPFVQRMSFLLSDLSVAYLHLVVPDRLGHRLPQIQTSWRSFLTLERAGEVGGQNRSDLFRGFIDRVRSTERTGLFFLHTELPHAPHTYLPSGAIYTASDNEPSGEGRQFAWWSEDAWAVTHSHQRHLLQVGFADRLLGELWTALDRAGLFEAALIVVTSDHGVSFQPGRSRRMLEAENSHDVLSIPMLIKLPDQQEGRVDERRVQTIDLLPTLADYLGVDWLAGMDGHSLLDSSWPGRHLDIPGGEITEAAFESQGRRSLAAKLDSFGTGRSHGTFVRAEPFPELVGRKTTEWANMQASRVAVESTLETGPGILPIQVTGTVTRPSDDGPPVCLAVAGDGAVRATTCSYRGRSGADVVPWSVLLETPIEDPGSLEVFVIDPAPAEPRLMRPHNS